MERKVVVDLTTLPAGEQKKCEGCSARCVYYHPTTGQMNNRCSVAELEERLGRAPTYHDALREGVEANGINESCPNGYIRASLRKMRD